MCGKQIENPERVIKVLYKIVRPGYSKTHSLPISGYPRKILVDILFELPWHLHPANQHHVTSIRARVWTLDEKKRVKFGQTIVLSSILKHEHVRS